MIYSLFEVACTFIIIKAGILQYFKLICILTFELKFICIHNMLVLLGNFSEFKANIIEVVTVASKIHKISSS
jgi:hypothetical protein